MKKKEEKMLSKSGKKKIRKYKLLKLDQKQVIKD